jgi:TRAP-type C4-dicarboxylate transport system permease small subunit
MLGLAAIIYFAQVVFRFVFNSPLTWSDEICGHLVILLSFAGAVLVLYEKGHISVTIVITSLEKSGHHKLRKAVELIADLLVLGFCGTSAFYGFIVAKKSMLISSATYQIPIGVIYSIIPVCFFMMGVTTIVKIMSNFGKKKEKRKRL